MSIINAVRVSRAPFAGLGAIGAYWGAFAAMAPEIKAQAGASDGAFGLALMGAAVGGMAIMYAGPRVAQALGRFTLPFFILVLVFVMQLPMFVHSVYALFPVMMLLGDLDVRPRHQCQYAPVATRGAPWASPYERQSCDVFAVFWRVCVCGREPAPIRVGGERCASGDGGCRVAFGDADVGRGNRGAPSRMIRLAPRHRGSCRGFLSGSSRSCCSCHSSVKTRSRHGRLCSSSANWGAPRGMGALARRHSGLLWRRFDCSDR